MTRDAITRILIQRGEDLLAKPFGPIRFTDHLEADALLNDLVHYPHAFVTACIMDRQIKAEKAWLIPYHFQARLGSFEITALQKLSLEDTTSLMCQPYPLHRFPNNMSKDFHSAIHRIVSQYAGNAASIWAASPDSATLVMRFLEFRGAGPKIATMAANILVRDFKIPVSDKIRIDVSPDVHICRVFVRLGLITEGQSNDVLIQKARQLSPSYPGVFDLPMWEIGRNWCRPQSPACRECYLDTHCPKVGV